MQKQFPPANLLGAESSPYLIQHADNPVHWRPWGPEALAEAQASQKPILLSIGYAACHWCHVMAHESFENESIAALMNRHFVNVKVDREERPDIDQIYMTALHAMGEQGGWPLTMFLDPHGRPFWGGTYFPPERRYGRPGFPDILNAIESAWQNQRDDLLENAGKLLAYMQSAESIEAAHDLHEPADTAAYAANVLTLHDPVHGGIRGAPKFPNATLLEVWLRASRGNAASSFGQAFLLTMERMSQGGIYDHLAGGLSRYSVDERWLVPHFEKMLYDNAHYIRCLIWAWKLDRNPLFRLRIEETIDWAAREMRLPCGAFASSLDADSEGEEGKFYVWSEAEVDTVLGAESGPFKAVYGVTKGGNFEGHTILNRLHGMHIDDNQEQALATSRKRLLEQRNRRERPGTDDKILADWNGYFIRALAEAGFAFERSDWTALALSSYRFVRESMDADGELAHSVRGASSVRPGMASDYGAMSNAALTLYEVEANPSFLSDAIRWLRKLEEDHGDDRGGVYFTSRKAEALLTRPRCHFDEANPSAASLALEALVRTATLSGDRQYLEKAWKLAGQMRSALHDARYGAAGYFNALDTLQRQRHVTIQAKDRAAAESFIAEIRVLTDPAITFVVADSQAPALFLGTEVAEPSKGPRAILCTQQTCSVPMSEPAELAAALAASN